MFGFLCYMPNLRNTNQRPVELRDPPLFRHILDGCRGAADKYVAEDREQKTIKTRCDENNCWATR